MPGEGCKNGRRGIFGCRGIRRKGVKMRLLCAENALCSGGVFSCGKRETKVKARKNQISVDYTTGGGFSNGKKSDIIL